MNDVVGARASDYAALIRPTYYGEIEITKRS
jgi:hypothetical protein